MSNKLYNPRPIKWMALLSPMIGYHALINNNKILNKELVSNKVLHIYAIVYFILLAMIPILLLTFKESRELSQYIGKFGPIIITLICIFFIRHISGPQENYFQLAKSSNNDQKWYKYLVVGISYGVAAFSLLTIEYHLIGKYVDDDVLKSSFTAQILQNNMK